MELNMHQKKWIKRAILIIIALGIIVGAIHYFSTFSNGTRVYAQREKNIWYSGKIDGTCAGGYDVIYDRGAQQCLTDDNIIKDTIAPASDIKVGSDIIAQWKGEPFYTAKVIEIVGDKYKVEYYDTVKNTISLSEMRLLKD